MTEIRKADWIELMLEQEKVRHARERAQPRARSLCNHSYPKPSPIRSVRTIMKYKFSYLLGVTTVAIVLSGCCTGRHTTQWEYKSARPTGNANQLERIDSLLNDMAKDGWALVEEDHNGVYIFKRAKR